MILNWCFAACSALLIEKAVIWLACHTLKLDEVYRIQIKNMRTVCDVCIHPLLLLIIGFLWSLLNEWTTQLQTKMTDRSTFPSLKFMSNLRIGDYSTCFEHHISMLYLNWAPDFTCSISCSTTSPASGQCVKLWSSNLAKHARFDKSDEKIQNKFSVSNNTTALWISFNHPMNLDWGPNHKVSS